MGNFRKRFNTPLILIFAVFSISNVQSSEIDCSDGSCQYDNTVNVSNIGGNANYSTLWITNFTDDILRIFTPSGDIPRDNKIFIRNGVSSKTLNVDLSSAASNLNGGNSVLITDIFNTILLNNSGSSGNDGKSSSRLCSENFKGGFYGQDSLDYWNNRDGSLEVNNCEIEDIDHLDGKFTCPTGFTEKVSGSVSVTRIEQKRKCSALYNQTRCVKRTFDIECKMGYVRRVCGNQNFSISDNGDYYISKTDMTVFNSSECVDLPSGLKLSGESITPIYRVTEAKLNQFSTQTDLCNDLIANSVRNNASYNYSYNDNGIPTTIQVQNKDVSFIDGAVKREFYWPLPDTMTDSKGDSISPTEMRVILKSWDQTGLKNLDTYGNKSKKISNCLGLNGSNLNDFQCEREPGPAFNITYNLIDKYGKISNDLSVYIPEGRKRLRFTYRYGWNWNSHIPEYQVHCVDGHYYCYEFTNVVYYDGVAYNQGKIYVTGSPWNSNSKNTDYYEWNIYDAPGDGSYLGWTIYVGEYYPVRSYYEYY